MLRNLSNINIATDVYVATGHLSDVEIWKKGLPIATVETLKKNPQATRK